MRNDDRLTAARDLANRLLDEPAKLLAGRRHGWTRFGGIVFGCTALREIAFDLHRGSHEGIHESREQAGVVLGRGDDSGIEAGRLTRERDDFVIEVSESEALGYEVADVLAARGDGS